MISPATTHRPVVSSVSQATRPFGSSARMASSTESLIWSAILSGWPSVTLSEVKVQRDTGCAPVVAASRVGDGVRDRSTTTSRIEPGRSSACRRGRRSTGSASRPQQRNGVGVVLEAHAGRGDVVGDDQVEVLGAELGGGVGDEIVGLGGEADEHLPGALARHRARRGCRASARARSRARRRAS